VRRAGLLPARRGQTGAGPQAGFTLVELLVGSVLMLVVLTLVIQIFIPALRAWADGQKRAEVGQSLLLTSNWLGEDVVRSAPDSLRVTDEGVLILKCALGQTTDHNNPFTQLVAYWQEGGRMVDGEMVDVSLYRASQLLSDPEAVPSVTLADVRSWKDRRRVASDVTTFEVEIPQPWRLNLHLVVKRLGRQGEIRTGYSSIYAPLDLEIAADNATPSESD
jgi:prepilin-type N-terminal cleavage/methylation domain-containing protein